MGVIELHCCEVRRWREGERTAPEPVGTWSVVMAAMPCRIELRSGRELGGVVDAATVEYRMFCGVNPDLQRLDRVVWKGRTLEVVQIDPDVSGRGHHAEALLKGVE